MTPGRLASGRSKGWTRGRAAAGVAAVLLAAAPGVLAALVGPAAGPDLPGAAAVRLLVALVLLALPLVVAHLATRRLGRRWRDYGFRWPDRWGRTIVRGVLTVGAIFLASALVVGPLRSLFGLPAADLSTLDAVRGDPWTFAGLLVAAWITAALGEELLFRGFLLNELAEALGGGTAGWAAGALLTSAIFGVSHFYQGPGGMLATGVIGLVLAGAYLAAGRDLWVPVLGHGLLDTVSLTILFLG